jgi:hypothetical protein
MVVETAWAGRNHGRPINLPRTGPLEIHTQPNGQRSQEGESYQR